MKFYIAARFSQKERVKEMYAKLRENGHEVGYDWTDETLVKPYGENEQLSQEIALKTIRASEHCDVFVLISDNAGTDMYVELGSAISSKKPKVYVVGEYLDRSKLFFYPGVKRMKGLDDVLKDLVQAQ